MSITVVKLGGSLLNTTELLDWINRLQQQSQHNTIIIVPGGGPFADQVRTAQQQLGFDDHTAHHMAILAMAQYGLLIASQISSIRLLYYPSRNERLSHGLHVWIPDRQLLTAPQLPHSWALTSDSLALWLSQQIHADELHIIKCIQPPCSQITSIVKSGILDEAFVDLYQAMPVYSKLYFYRDVDSYPDTGTQLQ